MNAEALCERVAQKKHDKVVMFAPRGSGPPLILPYSRSGCDYTILAMRYHTRVILTGEAYYWDGNACLEADARLGIGREIMDAKVLLAALPARLHILIGRSLLAGVKIPVGQRQQLGGVSG
jgi:hypothetical protein